MIAGEGMTVELAEPWPVLDRGLVVGRVTDAIFSPRLDANIGYAWVPIELSEPGTRIEIDSPAGRVEAAVSVLPFLDPKKQVPTA
jgi:aminomethyltransferase